MGNDMEREAVERVAIAIYCADKGTPEKWEELGRDGAPSPSADLRSAYRLCARAAIEAMPADSPAPTQQGSEAERVARAFIMQWCGLKAEHVSAEDIGLFLFSSTEPAPSLQAALAVLTSTQQGVPQGLDEERALAHLGGK